MAVIVALSACQAQYRDHGYAPSDSDLAKLAVGKDNRDTVKEAVGSPGTSGLLAESGWYYVQSRYKFYAYHEPKEIDRQVVAISFDKSGRVTNIERFGLERGEVVALSRRVTEPNSEGVGFLRQLFGSLGRFDPGRLFGQGNSTNTP